MKLLPIVLALIYAVAVGLLTTGHTVLGLPAPLILSFLPAASFLVIYIVVANRKYEKGE